MIKNVTALDEMGLKKLNQITLRRLILVLVIAIIVIPAMGIWFLTEGEESMGRTFIIFGIVFPLMMLLTTLIQIRKIIKNSKLNQLVATYLFFDDHIDFEVKGALQSNSGTLKYGFIRKYYETDGYFFLFENVRSAFIVRKSGFENPDDVDTLREYLQKNLVKRKKL